jgi:CRP-like cAMP-binding protein
VAVIPPIAAVSGDHRVGSFWRRLTDEERVALASSARSRRFETGALLIRSGYVDEWAVVLHSGRVRVFVAGGPRPIALRWAGDIVGEQALLDHGERSASVLAETSVHGLIIGRREFDRVVERHPRVMRMLGAVVSERLREADHHLSGQHNDAFTKVAEMLLRYVNEFGAQARKLIRIGIGSQAALGESLGMSRESVVRALKSLRDGGLITTDRGVVVIHDIEELRKIAGR